MIASTLLQKVLYKAPFEWLDALEHGADKWGINTPDRFAAFAGQLAHECAEFTHLEENLRYSAKRLCEVWPKRFPDEKSAEPYAFNPQALANKVYASRMGNGPEESGDGWLYHGRGPIQLTGFENYHTYGTLIGMDLVAHPERLLTPLVGIAVAGCFWQRHGCNEFADSGNHAAITRAINGGSLGLAQRIELTEKIRSILG